MADSGAVRARRARQHAQGDHTMCLPARCEYAGTPGAIPPESSRAPNGRLPRAWAPVAAAPADPTRAPGLIEQAVVAFVDTLPYRPPDARALMAIIAVRLAQRVDETGALPAAVRELRVLLAQLVETPKAPVDSVDEARLRAAQRKLDIILSQAV